MTTRVVFGLCAVVAVLGSRNPFVQEREDRTLLNHDQESALHASRLPWLHRDPFDRLLVAQAIVHGTTILTPDPILARYPARTMW